MNEKIVNSVLGYVNGCIKNGVKSGEWKVVFENGLVWLVNEKIGLRIREKLEVEK